MEFNEYQSISRQTARYPKIGEKFIYPVLGLVGEAGEVAEKVKKLMRNDGGHIDEEFKRLLKKELGDVLWYLSQIASEFDLSFDEVARHNLDKVLDRQARGVIESKGDER